MEVYGGGRRDLFCTYNKMMETLPIIYKPKHPTRTKKGERNKRFWAFQILSEELES
jgi:hypothetical protein